MKLSVDQREYLDALLDGHEGDSFSRSEVVADFTCYLRDLAATDGLDEMLAGLSQAAVSERLNRRAWKAEAESQMALFDPCALLALGDDEYIHMRDARAEHLDRHRTILNKNFRAVSLQHHAKTAYMDKRLPLLRDSGLTLGEVEGEDGLQEAA